MGAAPEELLRFATVGSVDDGKSTLIGRLLVDTASAYDDQQRAVERVSRDRGDEYLDLALFTDGLRAEREQGITIDVAHRYFSTARRRFVVLDCPGHVHYTRNMVSGVSRADVALLLVDARAGLLEQTKRHAFLASLVGVPHVVLCINKMDLVGFNEDVYERVSREFTDFATRLRLNDVVIIPISALHGDNVVERSARMAWYEGPALLYQLEHVHIASDRDLVDVRFPVQTVIRPRATRSQDYRAYAGQVAGGVLKKGDDVLVLPAGLHTSIEGIETFDGAVTEAFPPMSVAIRLASQVDLARGDMIARPNNAPTVASEFEAMIFPVWDREITVARTYAIQHTTRSARAEITKLRYRVDIETLHRDELATGLRPNDIGRVRVRTTTPLIFDPYRRNRNMGSFILTDEADNQTIAAGVILEQSDG